MLLGYDLGFYPITYDFVYWLVRAEEARIKVGAESLGILFQPGEAEGFRLKTVRDYQLTAERKRFRLETLLLPLAYRIPSVSSAQISPIRLDIPTPKFNIHDDIHKVELSPFRASEAARAAVNAMYPEKYVTITLRQSDVQKERNSDRAEWDKVARWLRKNGLQPVFVPDTEAVITGRQTGCMAAFNCFTSGGPAALAAFSDCRYLTVKMLSGDWTEKHMKAIGIEDGSDRGPFRETYYFPDTYLNVVQVLERFLKIESNRDVRPVFDAQTHYRGHLIQPVAHG
jgi:hypothetical protein